MFKEKFKYYKKKHPEPSYEDVMNMRVPNLELLSEMQIQHDSGGMNEEQKYGLIHPSLWNIYELKSCPGFIYIVNPFTSAGQRYWICRSLSDYTKKPSVSNIDPHKDLVELMKHENWWDIVSSNSKHSRTLKEKLRWVTMGYHHNWNTKVYSELSKDPFPKDLNQLSQFIVKTVLNDVFQAEACIVNFYHMDSSLSGHTDRSEPNTSAPLVSFSFGQNAIFLIGGTTLDETPHAILVESGDIAIMFGNSRLRYHGVPKILSSPHQPWANYQANYDLRTYFTELSCGELYNVDLTNIPKNEEFFNINLNGDEFRIPNGNFVPPTSNENEIGNQPSENEIGNQPPENEIGNQPPENEIGNQPPENENGLVTEKISWSHCRTLLLISLYKKYEEKTVVKKFLYDYIMKELATYGYKIPVEAVESKWKALVRSYKKACQNAGPKKSGRNAKPFKYFDEMHEILGKKHFINPPCVSGRDGFRTNLKSVSTAVSPPSVEQGAQPQFGSSDNSEEVLSDDEEENLRRGSSSHSIPVPAKKPRMGYTAQVLESCILQMKKDEAERQKFQAEFLESTKAYREAKLAILQNIANKLF